MYTVLNASVSVLGVYQCRCVGVISDDQCQCISVSVNTDVSVSVSSVYTDISVSVWSVNTDVSVHRYRCLRCQYFGVHTDTDPSLTVTVQFTHVLPHRTFTAIPNK